MRIPGTRYELRRITNTAVGPTDPSLSGPSGGWFPLWRTPDFQTSDRRHISQESILSYFAVYACISLIAGDIAKMCLNLKLKDTSSDIWIDTESPAFSPFLRKPNRYQTRVKFIEWWITSKLTHGNTYALKVRDARGLVTAAYILNPMRVQLLLAPDGSIFYNLGTDYLSEIETSIVVPAREMFHDIMCPLFHPLCGVSPLIACAMAAIQGLKIQDNSTQFFASGSQPSGIITAPTPITEAQAARIAKSWDANFGGPQNAGKVAMLGDGMSYQQMSITAHDAQLIEQLRWTAEVVCACFHVPTHKINIGPMPNYNNIEALDLQYYTQALQTLIVSLEAVLDEGLELPRWYRTDFDIEDLSEMDSKTRMETAVAGVGGGIDAPNEARAKFNKKPMAGGDNLFLQQQYWPIWQLSNRPTPAAPATPTVPQPQPPARLPTAAIADRDAFARNVVNRLSAA